MKSIGFECGCSLFLQPHMCPMPLISQLPFEIHDFLQRRVERMSLVDRTPFQIMMLCPLVPCKSLPCLRGAIIDDAPRFRHMNGVTELFVLLEIDFKPSVQM